MGVDGWSTRKAVLMERVVAWLKDYGSAFMLVLN